MSEISFADLPPDVLAEAVVVGVVDVAEHLQTLEEPTETELGVLADDKLDEHGALLPDDDFQESELFVVTGPEPGLTAPRAKQPRKVDTGDEFDDDLLKVYLQEIGQWPILTKEDEVSLAQAIEAGKAAADQLERDGSTMTPGQRRAAQRLVRAGKDAEKHFVQANLRLVVSIAKRYQSSGMPLLDLIQEGNLGMMHAVEKFDWQKGFKFSTYATWWIRQAIARGIANTGRTIRLPVHAGDILKRLNKEERALHAEGRVATIEDLAAALDISPEEVKTVLGWRRSGNMVSFDAPLDQDSSTTIGDMIPDGTSADGFHQVEINADLLPAVAGLLDLLDGRAKQVVSLRFGLEDGQPKTLAQVGELLGLNRETIRKTEQGAFKKMRHSDRAARMGGLALRPEQ